MQETSLHAALKNWYTRPGDSQETPVDGYLIDVVSGDRLIEIQTRHFHALKPKLAALLENHQVCLVHPIAQEKWIIRMPKEGDEPIDRRKSPKRGRVEHLFLELVRIPHLVLHPNFCVEVLLTREEEIRRDDGRGSWRRKGWSIADRRLLEVVQRVVLASPQEYAAFLPPTLPLLFTNRDLAAALGVQRYLAQKTVYCLRAMGLVQEAGRRGRAFLYARTENVL